MKATTAAAVPASSQPPKPIVVGAILGALFLAVTWTRLYWVPPRLLRFWKSCASDSRRRKRRRR